MSRFRSCYSQSVESSDSSVCENGRRFQTYWPPDDDSSISSRIKWYCTDCEGLICESISSGPIMQYVVPPERKIDYFREREPFRNPIVNTPVENMLKAVEVMHRSLNSVEPKRNSKDASTSTKHDHKTSTVSVNTDKRQWFAVEEDKVYEYSHSRPASERESEIKRPPVDSLHSFVHTEKRPSFVAVERKQSFLDETSKGPSPIKQAILQSRFSLESNTSPERNELRVHQKTPSFVAVERKQSFLDETSKGPSPIKQAVLQSHFSLETNTSPERNELRVHQKTSDEERRDSHVTTNAFNVENRSPSLTRPLFYNFRADSKTDILTLIEKLELAKMRLKQEEKLFEKEASMAKTKRSFFKN